MTGKVLIRRPIWLAWYPLRGRRCTFHPERCRDGWHLSIAAGPLYLGVGPGTPSP